GEEKWGFAAAYNSGIETATGEYVAFLDQNDEFVPDKIECQLLEMLANGSAFSHTNYYDALKETDTDVSNICGDAITDVMTDRRISISTVMANAHYLRDNGIAFVASPRFGGDICFCLDCLKYGKIAVIKESLSRINVHGGDYKLNNANRLTALKAVINHVLAQPEFSKYDDCLTRLSTEFISFYYDENVNKDILESLFGDFTRKKRSIIRRTLSAIKHRGIIATLKAGIGKIKRRLIRK
ncbi:MAG: glycosyltransferase, partial [Clostridia bacterium]|nr:glycosyltransferase [Clostridia bacterium]